MSIADIDSQKTKYFGIYRCSTEERKQQFGIMAQKTEVAEIVKRKNGILLEDCLEERISGVSLEEDRERLIESLEYCKSQGFVAIVAKLDRIARREDLLHNLVRKYKIHFCDIDSGDPLHISVAAAIAAQEHRRIKDRSIRGQKESEKVKGIRNGAARTHLVSVSARSFGRQLKPPAPLSPEAIKKGIAKAAKVNRKRNLERWEGLRRYIVGLHELKISYANIAKTLNNGTYAVVLKLQETPRMPLHTPVGKTKFTKATVRRALIYFGVIQKAKS